MDDAPRGDNHDRRTLIRFARTHQGFTLLELLLTLVVLAAIASVSLPGVFGLLGNRTLVRGGDELEIQMMRLRVDAMRQGRVMMLQGQVGGGKIRIRPYYSQTDATESVDGTSDRSSLLTGGDQPTILAVVENPDAEQTLSLGDGLQVQSVSVAPAARGLEIEQQAEVGGTDDWSRPILFYPDGTTSTAAVVVAEPEQGRVIVKLRGITGEASVSEVLP